MSPVGGKDRALTHEHNQDRAMQEVQHQPHPSPYRRVLPACLMSEYTALMRVVNAVRDSVGVAQSKEAPSRPKDERIERRRQQNRDAVRKWRATNPNAQDYHIVDTNLRRARKLSKPAFWTIPLWRQAKEKWGNACAYCGKKTDKLCADHFIPITSPQTSGTVPWNMVPACRECNASKRVNHPVSWVKSPERLNEITAWLNSIQRDLQVQMAMSIPK